MLSFYVNNILNVWGTILPMFKTTYCVTLAQPQHNTQGRTTQHNTLRDAQPQRNTLRDAQQHHTTTHWGTHNHTTPQHTSEDTQPTLALGLPQVERLEAERKTEESNAVLWTGRHLVFTGLRHLVFTGLRHLVFTGKW